jgi:hypothetical protein
MEPQILLGRIFQRFIDQQYAQIIGYNRFGFIELTNNYVLISREAGEDTKVPFSKIIIGIEAYQMDNDLYHQNTTPLRDQGITHVTSPVFALLHLLPESAYRS